MGWFYPKKSAECKHECTLTDKTMDTASLSLNLHLFVIFGIVLSLLWLSHYTTYKAQQNHIALYVQLFLFLSPILLILFLLSYSTCGRINFCFMSSRHKSLKRATVSP
ncbi:hypothetical protein PHAVU_011G026400 [Phaseolus vulgaris]|uniref:Uncharacterized protein n=1 Tax=Phaseolus vulgaris TaxID=3885 RepID=V7AFH0_PHAVU|nr:hypothetical protein PHAVU_011G026400g [Phaseolus vulgaris]ESW03588.1 hypothetical protein PHAVU_011G026400g [Phaseolus vulgaris]